MRLRNKLAIIAAATLGCSALPAQALVQVTAYEYSPEGLGGGISLGSAGFNGYGSAGRFLSTIQDTTTMNSWQQYTFCLDVLKGYFTYEPYADVALSSVILNAGKANMIAGLLTYADGMIAGAGSLSESRLNAAAFGLAIWEVVHETTGVVDATAGDFRVYGDFAAAGARANTFLGNVLNGTWTGNAANVRVLASTTGQNQNQVYITAPVPEPSTWAMLLSGFALIGTALRRRTKQALAFAK